MAARPKDHDGQSGVHNGVAQYFDLCKPAGPSGEHVPNPLATQRAVAADNSDALLAELKTTEEEMKMRLAKLHKVANDVLTRQVPFPPGLEAILWWR